MISFADAPLVVTIIGNAAADDGDILLFGIDEERALILAAHELLWVDLDKIRVETSLAAYDPIE